MVKRLVSADNETGELAPIVLANLDGRYSSVGQALPPGITGDKTYIPRQQVYNNNTSMRKARSAYARAQTAGAAPMNVLLKADSIGQSTTAAPFNTNSWFARLQSMVESRVGKYGSGMNFLMDVGGQDTRWAQTGTWNRLADKGMVGGLAYTTTTPGSTATFTDDFDTITVYFLRTTDGGADSSYSLNGATAVPFSSNGSEAVGSFTLTATRSASNKLVLTAPSSGRMTILAVDVRIGTTMGVRFQKAAFAGQKVGNFTRKLGAGDPLSLSESIAKPDLTIIALETNDYANGPTPLSSYVAGMRTLIESGLTTGSVALVATPTPQRRRGPDGTGGTSDDVPLGQSPTLQEYTQALYSLADEYDVAVIDFQARWGDWSTADAAGLMVDDYHPSDRGNWDYAQAVYEGLFGYGQTDQALTASARTFTARQRFGVNAPVELGQFEAGGFPSNRAYILSTASGGFYLGNESGGLVMVRSNFMMQAGRKVQTENGNLPLDIDAAVKAKTYTTATMPSASILGAGSQIYNTTVGKPVWSDGSAWKDATGTVVS